MPVAFERLDRRALVDHAGVVEEEAGPRLQHREALAGRPGGVEDARLAARDAAPLDEHDGDESTPSRCAPSGVGRPMPSVMSIRNWCASTILRARYPDDDELLAALPLLITVACHYGLADEAMAEAEELHRRTLARYGDDNLYVDQANLLRGDLFIVGARYADAVAALEQAHRGLLRHIGEKSPDAVLAQLDLADAYLGAGRGEDSKRRLDPARLAIARDHGDDKRVAGLMADAVEQLEKVRSGEALRCGS